MNVLRSRSPLHGEELVAWTDGFFASAPVLEEAEEERRLRRAACLLADVGWRAHPDYRGEQSLNMIAHAAFAGIDHPAGLRGTVGLFRHVGLGADESDTRILELVTTGMLDRARILGAAMRVAYVLSPPCPASCPACR